MKTNQVFEPQGFEKSNFVEDTPPSYMYGLDRS